MDDPNRSGGGRDRRLILAILALGLVIGGVVYEYSDALTEFVLSVTGGKVGRAQPRFHY